MTGEGRISVLREGEGASGDRVVYWMQASQRTVCNPALEHAVALADGMSKPLDVLFVIDPGHAGASRRSFTFMLQGLEDVARSLKERGVSFSVRTGGTVEEAVGHLDEAAALVMDRGYLRHQNAWYDEVLNATGMPVHQVEANVVAPTALASEKEEWSAATLRRKISPLVQRFLHIPAEKGPGIVSDGLWDEGMGWKGSEEHAKDMKLKGPGPSPILRGGQQAAQKLFSEFLDRKIHRYGEKRNDPSEEWTSRMSPYLRFGQVSPVLLAVQASQRGGAEEFLEELIVRRELAVNFVKHNGRYDSYACLPEWASKTLDEHAGDRREYVYSAEEMERAETHDVYWNAAQSEMLATGRMHNYMRMYWGKKILEWSEIPERGYNTAVMLNDRYELDGRDPNGYAGVAWCFGKHDRPWKEREVFGKVRYMNARGLERKFYMPGYLDRVIGMLDSVEDGSLSEKGLLPS